MTSHRRISGVLVALTIAVAGLGAGLAPRAEAAVYWGGNSFVGAANLDGSQALISYPYELANGLFPGNVCGVAVNGSHLFWADESNDSIGRMGLSPSSTGRLHFTEGIEIDQGFVSGILNPCGVAVDGNHIYWASRNGRAIGRANLDGSAPQPRFIPGPHPMCGVTTSPTHIYWANEADSIGRARLDGSEVDHHFIEGASSPCGVAVNGTHIYWADGSSETIGRANLDGSAPDQTFIQGAGRPCGVAVNATHVYWAHAWESGRLVSRANLDGSNPTGVVASSSYQASCGVALDSRQFGPPPPAPASQFFFGKLKRNVRRGVAFINVIVPANGELSVTSRGLGWKLRGGKPAGFLANYVRRQLKIWPAGRGRAGRAIRRRLARRGTARIRLGVSVQQPGHLPSFDTKRLTLIRKGAIRKGTRAKHTG